MHDECIQGAGEAGAPSCVFAFLPLLVLSPVCSSDALALRVLCMCQPLTITHRIITTAVFESQTHYFSGPNPWTYSAVLGPTQMATSDHQDTIADLI